MDVYRLILGLASFGCLAFLTLWLFLAMKAVIGGWDLGFVTLDLTQAMLMLTWYMRGASELLAPPATEVKQVSARNRR